MTEPDQPPIDPAAAEAPVPESGARRLARAALRPVAVRMVERLAVRLEPALHDRLRVGADETVRSAASLVFDDVERALRQAEVERQVARAELDAVREVVDQVRSQLEGLGQAIAPSAGLPGVAERFEELRVRVNDLSRAVRAGAARGGEIAGSAGSSRLDGGSTQDPTPEGGPQPGEGEGAPRPGPGAPFDYVTFERRFRGTSEQVLATVRERYWEDLRARTRVLDIGCGRGELVGALAAGGVEARGVDLDPGMVEVARAAGLDVVLADAVEHLRSLPAGSLDAICALQVVEHLPFEIVTEVVELARSRLRPGGILIAETPNPMTMYVLTNSFILDPSHVWPLHPSLLTFVCEQAGFGRTEVRYFAPRYDLGLPLAEDRAALPEWAQRLDEGFERLNHHLFGPQDYAVVATALG